MNALTQIVGAAAVADAVFHYFSANNLELSKRAEKYGEVFRFCRFSALAWTIGRLLQDIRFPHPSVTIIQTKFASFWLSRFLVAAVAAKALGFIVQQINQVGIEVLEEQLKTRLEQEGVRVSWRQRVSFGTIASQQIVYVTLAIFSKFHITFASLSLINLYTLYKIACNQWMMVDWPFKRSNGKEEVVFRWKATSFIGRKAKEEMRVHLTSLLRIIDTFQIVNPVKPTSIYSEQNLPKQLQESGQVAEGQLSISLKGRKIELSVLDYCPGENILVPLKSFDPKMQMLWGRLKDGTTIYFRDICPEKAKKNREVEVVACVVSKFIRDNHLYLVCSSKELPEGERRSLERLMGYGGFSIKIEGDSFSREVDFEESFRSFSLVNQVTKVTRTIGGNEARPDYKVYAETHCRPFCERLLVWVKDETWEWCLAEIVWLDYTVGKRVQVTVGNFDANAKIAYGSFLEPDRTVVCFPKAFSELVEQLKETTVKAEIISKSVRNGFIYLECSSEALIPKKKKVAIRHTMDQVPLLSRIQFKYEAVFTPHFTEEGEECPLCFEHTEIMYSTCEASHLACKTCLKENFRTKMAGFALVNTKPVTLGERVTSYTGCIQQEVLPNCSICREVPSSEAQLSVWIGDSIPAEITTVNYVAGNQMHTKVEEFDPFYFRATATLSDGTVIEFYNVQPNAARRLIESADVIQAAILRKTIENGILHLGCASPALPSRDIFTPDQELEFTIAGFSSFGQPFGFLPSGEKVFLHTQDVVIGNEVRGYFWGEKMTDEGIVLDCLCWKKGQAVEMKMICLDSERDTLIVGRLTNNQKVLFFCRTAAERSSYRQGEVITAYIRNFLWGIDGDFYLIGFGEEIFPTVDLLGQ